MLLCPETYTGVRGDWMDHRNNNTRESTPVLREPLLQGSRFLDHQSSLTGGDLPYAPGIFSQSPQFGRHLAKSLPPIRPARTGEVKSGHNAPRFAQVNPSRASGHNPQATPRFWALSRLSNHRGWCRSAVAGIPTLSVCRLR